nr:ParB/RepB/Spo0J family partition protein [Ardenticatena sp.]
MSAQKRQSKKKRRLGKGLEALIPTGDQNAASPASAAGVREVPINSILPNPYQPRSHIDPDALEELAASIREHGLIQPLVVTQIEDGAIGERFQLIAGERRWRAAKAAGLETVPVVIKEASEQQMLEWALIENIQRADLNPIEEAMAYQQMAETFGLTHAEIATRVGKSRSAISNMLRLLKLPLPIQELVSQGTLSEGHARALLPLEHLSRMLDAVEIIVGRGLNVRQTEELVKRMLEEPQARPQKQDLSPIDRRLQERIQARLGTKVELKRGKKGGKVVIHFYSDDDLEQIYKLVIGEDDLS